MRDRWIVGVDGSADSRVALDWALRQSDGRDVDIDVVLANQETWTARVAATAAGRVELHAAERAAALDELEAFVASEPRADAVRRRVIDGSPGRVLVDAARDASLLVVGRHGSGGWRRTLGSVSRACVSRSPAPTVVVPSGWAGGGIQQVVVGFDGSDQSRAALRWAVAFSGQSATVDALIAIELAPWLPEATISERFGTELEAEANRLRSLLTDADPSGHVRPVVVIGDARPALADAADSTDLVVLGTHGAGRHGTALIGSVSAWMLDGATTPIAVVP